MSDGYEWYKHPRDEPYRNILEEGKRPELKAVGAPSALGK